MPSRSIRPVIALAAEDAHQVVFERQVEARAARVALAAGAAAQLVVDAARLVALGAEDVQAARRQHLLLLGVALRLERARTRSLNALRRPTSWPGLPAFSGSTSARAMNSALPPRMMSVPRPAMLVEIVTAPLRPACATM